MTDFTQPVPLRRGLSHLHLGAIGIGCVMGIAWVTLLGPLLGGAGPAGAVAGFLLGGLLMLLTAFCYAELAAAIPSSGGEVLYAHEVLGPGAAFAIGWFLLLMAIAITTFEAISLAWLLNKIFPGIEGTTIYLVAGEPIGIGALAIGLTGMCIIAIVNILGSGAAGRLQLVFTLVKGVAITAFIVAGIVSGSSAHLQPVFTSATGGSPFQGIFWIVATAPFWHGGFQVVAQAVEERRDDVTLLDVARITVITVVFSMIFYPLLVIAASMATPWKNLVSTELPAAAAMGAAFGSPSVATLCLLAAVLGLLATWNASLIWAARLFLALGRSRLLPGCFAKVHPRYGSPAIAVLITTGLGIPGVFVGRTAFLPIVNTAAISLAVGFCLTCCAAIRLRQKQPSLARPYRIPGGLPTAWMAVVGTASMMIYTFLEPLIRNPQRVPAEWLLLGLWSVLGALFWILGSARRRSLSSEQRRIALLGRAA